MPLDSDPFPWLALLGRAHLVLLHLPLGLLPALLVLEFGAALFRRPPPRGAVLTLAWLGAIAAGLAVASGLQLADAGGYTGDTVDYHKIAGIACGALCLVIAVLAFGQRRAFFRIGLLLACGAVGAAGHFGGSLTHGADFLLAPYHKWQAAQGEPAPEGDAAAEEPTPSEYEQTIAPFLERTCTKCHNPEKAKSGLVMTTPEGIRAGGDSGPVLVAGKPDLSEMLQLCLLPLDDEYHMPPPDKPQPTKAELEALRAWIAAGAKFE